MKGGGGGGEVSLYTAPEHMPQTVSSWFLNRRVVFVTFETPNMSLALEQGMSLSRVSGILASHHGEESSPSLCVGLRFR